MCDVISGKSWFSKNSASIFRHLACWDNGCGVYCIPSCLGTGADMAANRYWFIVWSDDIVPPFAALIKWRQRSRHARNRLRLPRRKKTPEKIKQKNWLMTTYMHTEFCGNTSIHFSKPNLSRHQGLQTVARLNIWIFIAPPPLRWRGRSYKTSGCAVNPANSANLPNMRS